MHLLRRSESKSLPKELVLVELELELVLVETVELDWAEQTNHGDSV